MINLTLPVAIAGSSLEVTVLNPDDWGDSAFLIRLHLGPSIVVLASNMQDALDEYADSDFGDHTRIHDTDLMDYQTGTDSEGYPEYGDLTLLGNAAEYHDLDYFLINEIPLRKMFGTITTYSKRFKAWGECEDEPELLGEDEEDTPIRSFGDLEHFFRTRCAVEASSSDYHSGVWYSSIDDTLSGTHASLAHGEVEEGSHHLTGFDPQIEQWLFNRLKGA